MEVATETDRKYRIRIRYDEPRHDGPVVGLAIPLVLELDPSDAGNINAFEVRIGCSVAQTRLIARRFFDSDDQRDLGFIASGHLRAIAQLWHALHLAHGGEIPVLFLALDHERQTDEPRIEGVITSADLEAVLQEVERKCNLGVRTRSLNPPIYLEAFWGPRPSGILDATIARLRHFNIVHDALLGKARRLDAPHNWAVVYPQDLPDRKQVLVALEPLIKHRGGRTFELCHGHNPAVIENFVAELTRMPVEERPYYLLVLGDFDVLSMEFQYFLQSFGAAGRLAFPTPHAYREYAEKIIRYEGELDDREAPSPTYIAADYDDVNARNYAELVRPLAAAPDLPRPREILARGRAYKQRVMEVLRRVPPHSPVLIFAHGFEHLTMRGHPIEVVFEDTREFQGSLILDDFQPPRLLGSMAGLLCATDVAEGMVAPGGVVILHACYSAGTINRDTMPEWVHLQMPEMVPLRTPFISRLAQALLSNPQGPLAVYGHVNRSHQYDYYNPEVENAPFTYRQYNDVLKALTNGLPVGLGRESCRRVVIDYMDQALTLSYQIEWLLTGRSRGGSGIGWPRKGVGAYELSFLQYSIASWNFRNYLILGDPMARIRKTTQGG